MECECMWTSGTSTAVYDAVEFLDEFDPSAVGAY